MKVELYYQTCHLGTLTRQDNMYVYNSDIAGENAFKTSNPLYFVYKLFGSVNKKSDKLFKEFVDFVNSSYRSDFVELGGIKESDDTFTRLYKVAGVELVTTGFYIKQA